MAGLSNISNHSSCDRTRAFVAASGTCLSSAFVLISDCSSVCATAGSLLPHQLIIITDSRLITRFQHVQGALQISPCLCIQFVTLTLYTYIGLTTAVSEVIEQAFTSNVSCTFPLRSAQRKE